MPQHRERIFIVGFKDPLPFEFPTTASQRVTRNAGKPILEDILEKTPDPKYTLSDKLWNYLQNYAKKHKDAGNGFGCEVVSPDDVASHKKFSEKFSLNFPLLVDTDHKLAEKYGAWREKNMYGKVSMGIQRSTFLIDAEGAVVKVWKKVSVDGHDQQVIDALQTLADA